MPRTSKATGMVMVLMQAGWVLQGVVGCCGWDPKDVGFENSNAPIHRARSLAAMSLTNVTIDDFSSLFAYSDAWTAPDTSDRSFPNGDQFLSTLVDATYHATKLAGKNATLSFAGTAIYLYGTTGPAQGFYDVNLDNGVTSAPVSAYAAANTTNHLLYSATGLTNTAHSVVLTNLGSMNGSGNELLIDYALGTALVGAAGSVLAPSESHGCADEEL